MSIKIIDLFAGIGGFHEGFRRASISTKKEVSCVYANEWDRYANSIYQQHFGECDLRDITTVATSDIPDHDILCGGFPCQSFSVAGKRRGFEDTRGTMFFEIARILRDKRPRYFLLENVKGLLSHDSGKTFATILGVLTDLGYDVQWQILNSKDFGVPQNRERIYLVGNLRGEPRPKVFPITDTNEIYPRPDEAQEEVHDLAQTLTARQFASWNGNYIHQLNDPVHSNDRIYATDGIAPTLNTMQGGRRQPFVLTPSPKYSDEGKRSVEYGVSDIVPTIRATQHKSGDNQPKIAVPNPFVAMRWVRTEKGKEARREAQKNGRDYTPFNDGHRELVPAKEDVIGTITSQAISKDSLLGDDTRIRKLTPMECERLQGFPDGWTASVSDSQRYKCLGNAVTVNVVEFVAGRLLSGIEYGGETTKR